MSKTKRRSRGCLFFLLFLVVGFFAMVIAIRTMPEPTPEEIAAREADRRMRDSIQAVIEAERAVEREREAREEAIRQARIDSIEAVEASYLGRPLEDLKSDVQLACHRAIDLAAIYGHDWHGIFSVRSRPTWRWTRNGYVVLRGDDLKIQNAFGVWREYVRYECIYDTRTASVVGLDIP